MQADERLVYLVSLRGVEREIKRRQAKLSTMARQFKRGFMCDHVTGIRLIDEVRRLQRIRAEINLILNVCFYG